MDYKNILEGARPFFQGLPQPLSQSNSTTAAEPTGLSAAGKEKEVIQNHHSLSHNHHPQLYHPSVITNHNSGSVTSRNVNSNGSGSAVPNTGSSGSNNINTISTKNDKDSSASGGGNKAHPTLNNNLSESVGPGHNNSSNTSGKTGNSSTVPTHPLLHGGFGSALAHSQRSSQSHVPVHVPLTLPLPNHHQERSHARSKYEEGLGATLSQMYAGTIASSRGSAQGRHVNGAPTGLLQTAPPLNVSHTGGNTSGNSSGSAVNSGTVTNSMGGTSIRRESPLDLSVKTVRQSADSSTPLEAPVLSSGMNGSGGGTRSLSSSGASTPNMLVNQHHHYPLHSSSLQDGSSNVSSATGSTRSLPVGDAVNSVVVAAVANSTTGVGLSSNESRSSNSKSGRGRSREKSHEREPSSSRSRTSTPTGNSSGSLRYPSPAHIHRQQSPSGTASPHMHQRVASLQLNIPNPTPPPRTGSGSSVNSASASGTYNPSVTPQPLHPSPSATPVAPAATHPLFSQHPYAQSPAPPGAASSSTGKGAPPNMGSYHSHYPGIPTPSHHPSSTSSSNTGSQHLTGAPPPSPAIPPASSNPAAPPGNHHSQHPKHSSAIPPYNPPTPNFNTSLNSGYTPPNAHHQAGYQQYHHYPPPHPATTPSHSVPSQSPAPVSHHPHHAYYSSVYGHHPHLQQPPPVGTPHQRSGSVTPSTNHNTTLQHGSGTSSAAPIVSTAPTASSAHPSQYLQSKHPGYAYPPSTQSQPSQSQQPAQVAAAPSYYHHSNPAVNSYYAPQHQIQHAAASSQIPQQSRPPSTPAQHHATIPGYPTAHYGHPQNPATATPYSHGQQHLYSGMTQLSYPTYVPQAQRTQQSSYPPVQQGYVAQSSYYQGPPGLRPSTPTGPPPPQQQQPANPAAPYPPPQVVASGTVTPGIATGKSSPSSAETPSGTASDMKPPQNPLATGKSSKSGNSRKNLLHMLRNSVENRMHEKQDKFQFNHQTWNFHGRKFNTTLPPLNSSSSTNGNSTTGASHLTPSGGVESPGSSSYPHNISRPTSPNGSSSFGLDAQKGAAVHHSKYDSSSSYGGGGSSTASSTYGANAGSESSATSGIGSLSDSSQLNRIRTKAEKKQLFPNLLSQIEQENSHKEAEKLQQQQQQHQQVNFSEGAHFYAQSSVGGVPGIKNGTSANALSNSSKIKLSNSTSVFDFREDDDDLLGSKNVPQVPPATTPATTVLEGTKPPKKPRSPKKAAEPGSRRNSLPKEKGQKAGKKVKQTPEQQQELMAAVIASVAASSSQAAAEAHQKYLESLKNKDLSSTKEPIASTPLRIPNPSATCRDISTLPPTSSEKDSASKVAGSGTGKDNAEQPKTATSTSSKAAAASTALESMDAFWDVCDSFLDDLQSNPVSIKSRRGGLWQKLKEKAAKPKAGDNNNGGAAPSASSKVRKGRLGPRIRKNSSEEDSDFEVEKSSDDDDDEDDDDDSEQSDKSDSDDSNSMSISRKGSNSGDSSGFQRGRKGVKKKKKRIIESEDEEDGSGKEEKASGDEKSSTERQKKGSSRSVSSKKRSTSKATSKADSSDLEAKASNRRGRKKGNKETGKSGSASRRRRSARKRKTILGSKSGITTLSDLDEDEDATSRTSIGSESDASVDSDSEASSFGDSSLSDDSDSNAASDDSNSDDNEELDGQSLTSSRKRKKVTKTGKKSKRVKLSKSGKRKEKGRKSRKSGGRVETKRTRSSSTKNGKRGSRSTSTSGKKDKENMHESDFSDDDSSVDIKRSRSLRSRSRGQKQNRSGARKLRPKRNCAPAPGNGKLKDISESGDEEGGSSGEEWIMRTELGKKKRRIVFGDGSEFQRPGWEEELIDFKKKLRMPHKLIRVAKPSSLSLSPSGNGAQSTASSVTGGIVDSGISPAKSTKENKSPFTPAKGSKSQKTREKSPEKDKDLPDLIREKPVESKDKEKKTKGRTSKTAVQSATSTTPGSTPNKADASTKGKETSTEKPASTKGKKGGRGKAVAEKKPDISESSLDEPVIERAVEQMKAATKRDSKSGSTNNVSASVKATIDAVVKSAEKKEDVGSEKDKKAPAPSTNVKASASVAGAETVPLPNAEVPSPSSSTSAATPTPVAKKTLRRNKFKSGFDYIRKKKKATAPDVSAAAPPPKRVKAVAEKNTNVEDIQAEVRGWVLNKGLGETALHRAARLGYPDVASWCLDTDYCQPNCKDNAGYTPLHETCIKGNLEVAKVLLKYGANPSQAAPGGIRPLHEACENGHVELVRLLISFGADPIVATYGGQTPLELAENHEPVRLLLQQHINDVQGREDNSWEFRGSGLWAEEPFDNGFDVTVDPPQHESDLEDLDGFEFESSEMPLPHLYQLKDHPAHYVLLNEVLSYLGQPRDRLLQKLPGAEVVELNSNDFLEQAHCCHLLGEKFNFNAISELTLIKYDDRIKKMLGIESCRIK